MGGAGPARPAGSDDVLCLPAPERRCQRAGHPLAEHQAFGQVQVVSHSRGSTSSAPRLSRSHAAPEPTARSRSVKGRHSACHAPAARWCSWCMVERSVATSPGAGRTDARALIAATGLPLCGIADEAPRPSPASHLRHLGLGQEHDVRRHLADRTGRAAEGAGQLGDPGPLGVPRRRRLEPGAVSRSVPRGRSRARRTPSVPAAPPSCAASRSSRTLASRADGVDPRGPTGGDQPERGRHGVLQQRASGHRAARWVLARSTSNVVAAPRSAMIESRLLRDQHRCRVEDVLARRARWTLAAASGATRRQGAHRSDHRSRRRWRRRARRRRRVGAAAAAIASAWATGASPTSASAQVNAASASSIACNHAAPDVASQTGPCASTSSNSPRRAPLRRRRRRSHVLPGGGHRTDSHRRLARRPASPATRSERRQQRVGCVRLLLVAVDAPRPGRAGRANTETAMYGACRRPVESDPPGLDGADRPLAVGVGRAATEAAEAGAANTVGRAGMVEAAVRVGLPGLDQRAPAPGHRRRHEPCPESTPAGRVLRHDLGAGGPVEREVEERSHRL